MTVSSQEDLRIGRVDFQALDYDPLNGVFVFLATSTGRGTSAKRTWAYRPLP